MQSSLKAVNCKEQLLAEKCKEQLLAELGFTILLSWENLFENLLKNLALCYPDKS
jgi:hypothetical protein